MRLSAEMSDTMPAESVDTFFRFFVDGTLDESEVLPTVQKLTGNLPATLEEWATRHAAAFQERATNSTTDR
jgi:hypothetical protein